MAMVRPITRLMDDADLGKLKFPRAQLEKAVLLLAGQQRLTHPQRRRGRSGSISSRPWFVEALTLIEITQAHTPEGRATLRRLRAQQHQEASERRASTGADAEAGAPVEKERAVAAGRPAEEAEGGKTTHRRRSRRGGSNRGRRRRPGTAATNAAAGEAGERAPDLQAPPRQPHQQRQKHHPPPVEDRPFDPDAAFGDSETGLEPAGGESPEDRTG